MHSSKDCAAKKKQINFLKPLEKTKAIAYKKHPAVCLVRGRLLIDAGSLLFNYQTLHK